MSGVLSKYGENPGSLVPAEVIPATMVPADDEAMITDFGATVRDGGSASEIYLQLSRDGFVSDIRTKSFIEITKSGTVFKSLEKGPVRVVGGESFRVMGVQGVASKMTAELFGQTQVNDIGD